MEFTKEQYNYLKNRNLNSEIYYYEELSNLEEVQQSEKLKKVIANRLLDLRREKLFQEVEKTKNYCHEDKFIEIIRETYIFQKLGLSNNESWVCEMEEYNMDNFFKTNEDRENTLMHLAGSKEQKEEIANMTNEEAFCSLLKYFFSAKDIHQKQLEEKEHGIVLGQKNLSGIVNLEDIVILCFNYGLRDAKDYISENGEPNLFLGFNKISEEEQKDIIGLFSTAVLKSIKNGVDNNCLVLDEFDEKVSQEIDRQFEEVYGNSRNNSRR